MIPFLGAKLNAHTYVLFLYKPLDHFRHVKYPKCWMGKKKKTDQKEKRKEREITLSIVATCSACNGQGKPTICSERFPLSSFLPNQKRHQDTIPLQTLCTPNISINVLNIQFIIFHQNCSKFPYHDYMLH